jgi:hypothetical protein
VGCDRSALDYDAAADCGLGAKRGRGKPEEQRYDRAAQDPVCHDSPLEKGKPVANTRAACQA